MKKARVHRGETLVETLVAILMLTLIMLGLSTAVISAAKVNAQVRDAVKSCTMSHESPQAASVTLRWSSGGENRENSVGVTEYADNGYCFYEKNP